MPVYSYDAVDRKGRMVRGQMPAVNEASLEEKLIQTDVWLVDARMQSAGSVFDDGTASRRSWFTKVTRRELIDFCTLMCFQTQVGVPLVQAIEIARQDCESPYLEKVLNGLQRHLEGGLLSYEALQKYPQVFSPHFVAVIRAGEASGKLSESFHDLREYLEWVDRVVAEVRQASLYPAITLAVVMAFVVGLFIFIIPKFAALLTSVNAKLPLMTEIVFGASDFVKGTWWVWLLVLPGLIMGALLARRYSPRVERWFDQARMSMPLFGPLNAMLAISRFTHNLAILYGSGIPILSALHLCRGLTGSIILDEAVDAVEQSVKSGSRLSEAMRRHPIFPPLLLRMVHMGETTGSLDRALENVSSYYNEIIPRRIKKIITMLEPALTLFLIGLVLMVALSIYLPILTLMSTIR